MSLDKTDNRILYELDRNARISIKKLAQLTCTSRDKVSYRIQRLEKVGIIDQYYALIDYSKLGYSLIRQHIKFKNTTPEIELAMFDFFKGRKNIFKLYEVEVAWDLVVGVLVKDLKDFNTLFLEFKSKFGKYIQSSNSSVFIEYIHYFRNYLSEENDVTALVVGGNSKIEVDNPGLIELLAREARLSLTELAKKLNLSLNAVKYQKKKLEASGIIIGYRAKINHELIGYEYYNIDLFLDDGSIISSLREFCKQHKNIIYENRPVGGSDFEFNVEVKSHDNMIRIVNELKSSFPEQIRSWHYYKQVHTHEYNYFGIN